MKNRPILFVCTFLISMTNLIAQDGWTALFNGKDFKNFEQLNGDAKFEAKNGEMIGTSKLNTPNSFLATKNKYADFILEFDVLVENDLNSGVQFRSLSKPEYNDGPKGQNAFVPGQWNHYRIEAIGTHIRTWVNDVQCANLVDDTTAEGFIAFQVHGIGDKNLEGKTVRWKNIKIKTSDLEISRKGVDSDVPEISYLNNQLTNIEMRTGWRLLWDGQTTDGWRGAKLKNFPEKGWNMNDGILTVEASGGAESRNGGDIVTKDSYSNFELSVDFKITEGANSGIKYFVDSELNKGEGSAIGLEFQILDDEKHPDGKQGKNGNRTVGSLYDLIRAENSDSSRGKNFKGVGKWNNARIVVKDGHVEHWLNQVKVVEFDRFSQIFRALVEKSKYEKWENFGSIPDGLILLQDHGDKVSFRSVKIREF